MKGLKKSVVDHYERQLRTYGPTARGMDWKDSASQQLRFAILCEVCDLNGRTVHEIAAGAGHLYDFLMDGNIDHVDYQSDDLYYANMGETLEFCQKMLSRYVVLRHDYPLYEYTVYVYRSAVTRQSHGPAD